jgi:hypothetical protein
VGSRFGADLQGSGVWKWSAMFKPLFFALGRVGDEGGWCIGMGRETGFGEFGRGFEWWVARRAQPTIRDLVWIDG